MLQQNNLPQPEHLANQILNDYCQDLSEVPSATELFAALEILGKEVALGERIEIYRNIAGGFCIMAEVSRYHSETACSITGKHELQDCLIRLAKKVLVR